MLIWGLAAKATKFWQDGRGRLPTIAVAHPGKTAPSAENPHILRNRSGQIAFFYAVGILATIWMRQSLSMGVRNIAGFAILLSLASVFLAGSQSRRVLTFFLMAIGTNLLARLVISSDRSPGRLPSMIFAVVFLIAAAGLLGVLTGYPIRWICRACQWIADRISKMRLASRRPPPIVIAGPEQAKSRPKTNLEETQ